MRYDLARQTLSVAGTSFTVTVIRDTNVLLDRIDPEAFAREERLPFWAEIWPSSLELARWSLTGGVARGLRVLELGCGLGLVGIAAAWAGARVTMTDYEPDALDFARLNVTENLRASRTTGRVEFALLDWRSPYRGARYPLVLGSDIMYDRSLFEPLLQRLVECLSPGGRVVLADPDRSIGRAFLDLAGRSGFTVQSTAVATLYQGRSLTVTRAVLRRRLAQ
jgi:predicted nicotinamide N-methyase